MTQPTFGDVRAALASYLTSAIGLAATPNRFAQVNPPMAVIMPVTGTFIRYSQTFDGETDYTLRIIVLVSEGDSVSGQDLIDAYLSVSGPKSIWAAIQADDTLGGKVSYAAVTEATGYGLMNFNGVDYLAAHLITSIGT
ncbi:MAG: hypothetical protein J2P30_00160 [Actinobacteria bacterium]|nr:hypothetical protein [Actinomycetota bacterium]